MRTYTNVRPFVKTSRIIIENKRLVSNQMTLLHLSVRPRIAIFVHVSPVHADQFRPPTYSKSNVLNFTAAAIA